MPPLTSRQSELLSAVVTEYTRRGEPVSSKCLSERYGRSSATIRSEMAELEAKGYLHQPHTSAGRVPTEAAFRVFIDALMRVEQQPDRRATHISNWFGGLPPRADIVRETGRLLAQLSGSAAVLLRPRLETRPLAKVHFVSTRPGELLCVLVLEDGTLDNRVLSVDEAVDQPRLERLHNLLVDVAPGRSLRQLHEHFRSAVRQQRSELGKLYGMGVLLLNAAIDGTDRNSDVVIEGQAALLEQFDRRGDSRAVWELLEALEDRERLVELLESLLPLSRAGVLLGEQTSKKVGYPVSLVGARFGGEGQVAGGALGVIGPVPMDYSTLVPLVRTIALGMTRALTPE